MTKFKCVVSRTSSIPLGTIIKGDALEYECGEKRIILSEDVDVPNGIVWKKGFDLPLHGNLWEWEEVKELDPRKVVLSINGVGLTPSFADGEVIIKYRRHVRDYRIDYCTGLWLTDFTVWGTICINGSYTKPTKRQIRKWRREWRKSNAWNFLKD